MRDLIIEAFGLTKHAALLDKRIPKTTFFEQEGCDAQDRELLTDEVESLTLLAVFNTSTTNIPTFQDEDHHYEELYLFYVELRTDKHVNRIAELLHVMIPNPVLIVFAHEGKISLSTAEKRLNKNAEGKTVVEAVLTSPWMASAPKDDQERTFLASLAIMNWSHQSLLFFQRDAERIILASCLASIAGSFVFSYKLDILEATRLLQDYGASLGRIKALEKDEKDTSHFGEKMRIHMAANNERKMLESLTQTIKALVQSLT